MQKRIFYCNICATPMGAGTDRQGYGIAFKEVLTVADKRATEFTQHAHAQVEVHICERCLDACKRFRSEYSIPRLKNEQANASEPASPRHAGLREDDSGVDRESPPASDAGR